MLDANLQHQKYLNLYRLMLPPKPKPESTQVFAMRPERQKFHPSTEQSQSMAGEFDQLTNFVNQPSCVSTDKLDILQNLDSK